MKSISELAPVVLQTIFGSLATQLGRLTQFIRRQGKLDAAEFARTLCLFLIRYPKASLQQLSAELSITASALSQRFQQPATAEFLRQLLLRSLGELSLQRQRPNLIPLLQRFNGVYPTDCTTIGLPDGLVRKFPGCGGGAKKDDQTAAVKVLLQINNTTGQSTQLLIETGRTPDITMLNKLPPLPKGALEIADLGFFDTERFRAHNDRGGVLVDAASRSDQCVREGQVERVGSLVAGPEIESNRPLGGRVAGFQILSCVDARVDSALPAARIRASSS